MKKLTVVFAIVISGFAVSQNTIIDYNNFNSILLEQKILDTLNSYRVSIGLKSLHISPALKESYSSVTASLNAKQDKLYHVAINVADKNLALKFYKDLYRITKGQCGIENQDCMISMQHVGEIIQSSLCFGNDTYEQLAARLLDNWLASPKHKEILESEFVTPSGAPGLISCCIKKSKTDRYYVAVGFMQLFYISK